MSIVHIPVTVLFSSIKRSGGIELTVLFKKEEWQNGRMLRQETHRIYRGLSIIGLT